MDTEQVNADPFRADPSISVNIRNDLFINPDIGNRAK